MDIGGPELLQVVIAVVLKAQSRHVVEEGIDPYVYHMARVKVHRHAPGKAGPGDAQVLQARLDEVVHHLVDPAPGLQEVGVFQQVPDPVGILGEAEEIGLLLGILDLLAAVGALAVHQLALGPEALAGLAILALVGALVDVPVVVHLLKNLLDGGNVIIVSGTDEPVVGDVHQLPQVQHTAGALHDVVHELLGGAACLLGLVLDLLAVLIGAGEEHHIVALKPLIAGHGIGGHGAVGVANVELGRRIIDGCGNVKLSFAGITHRITSLKIESRPWDPKGDKKLTRYHLDL